MLDNSFLNILGGLIAGLFLIEILKAFARKMVATDYVTRADCDKSRANCATCIQAMKERQNTLREITLPKEFVAKEDFRRELGEVKDWLQSIDNKVEALLIRKQDLLEGKDHG